MACLQCLAFLQVPIGVLDLDRGIIHQDADSEGQAAQRHDVDGFAQKAQGDDRRQDGQRNGHRNDERAAPAAQEEQDHHARQARGDDRFADDAAHRGTDEDRLIGQGLNLQLRRQGRGDTRQHSPYALDHIERDAVPVLMMVISMPRRPS